MWNLFDPEQSVCLDPRFDSSLFDTYAKESNSCWMPELTLRQSKSVFAYFYHYVVGVSCPTEQKKLQLSLLDGIKQCTNNSHGQKWFKDLMKELYVTDSFCTGDYHDYNQARGMEFPWDN